jgi:hypothetical protein
MKQKLDKPQWKARLYKVGNSYALGIPKALVEIWEMETGKKYKIAVEGQCKENPENGGCRNLSLKVFPG